MYLILVDSPFAGLSESFNVLVAFRLGFALFVKPICGKRTYGPGPLLHLTRPETSVFGCVE